MKTIPRLEQHDANQRELLKDLVDQGHTIEQAIEIVAKKTREEYLAIVRPTIKDHE